MISNLKGGNWFFKKVVILRSSTKNIQLSKESQAFKTISNTSDSLNFCPPRQYINQKSIGYSATINTL